MTAWRLVEGLKATPARQHFSGLEGARIPGAVPSALALLKNGDLTFIIFNDYRSPIPCLPLRKAGEVSSITGCWLVQTRGQQCHRKHLDSQVVTV